LGQTPSPLIGDCIITKIGHVLLAREQLIYKTLHALSGDRDRPGNFFPFAVNITTQQPLYANLNKPVVAVRLVIQPQERIGSHQTLDKIPHRDLSEPQLRFQECLPVTLEVLMFAIHLAIGRPNQLVNPTC